MPDNVVGKIPAFDTDETQAVPPGTEEVKEAAAEEVAETEKETPAELPAEEKPAPRGDDTGDVKNQVQGLLTEKEKLLDEIKSLRGQRREIKQEEINLVTKQLDDLKDLYPEDINTIDRILRAKGYMTKDEANRMFYENVKNEELTKFLERFPEYKPDNDPNDLNWNALQRELKYYRMPENPHEVGEVLSRAHQSLGKVQVASDRTVEAKKRQIEVAGVGAKAGQRSSSIKRLEPEKRQILLQGGWSEDEIKAIEKNLPDN
jgi:hypothetical protein